MADVFDKQKRSEVMAAIRSKGNKTTEVRLIRILRLHGITGWRRHQRLPGRPDFSFQKEKVAVFVDGCFWHGCRWHCRMPRTRVAFWRKKITRNKQRDRETKVLLRKKGWKWLRLWEHQLRDPVKVAERINARLGRAHNQ